MVALKNIVIAGGGIVGNSVAYYLAKRDIPVTLIDPVGIAPGASSKAGGFLAQTWRDGTPLQQMQRLGFELHQELANELTGTDYRRLACAAVAVDEDRIVQKPPSRKVKDVEWVDRGVIGSQSMGGPDTIAQVHPRKLCEKMWEFSQSKGSKLEIGRVVRADVEKDDRTTTPTSSVVTSVQLDTGTTIPADVLVIACGPWTEEARYWFPDDLPGLDSIPTITGVKCHSILMQAPKVLNQAVFFESNGPLGAGDLEVYPRPDGDAYVNGFQGDEGIVQERPGQEAIEADAIRQLQSAMDDVSSLLEGRPPHTQQACYWPETPDGLPMIGCLSTSDSGGLGNAFIATGHSVWGILQGPATGKALAEWIVDGKPSCLDLTVFGLDRFSMDDQNEGSP